MIKTGQDYELTDCTSTFYSKNDTELAWLIGSGANSDRDQIGQLHDLSYKCDIC